MFSVCVVSIFSSFLPQSKNMNVMSTGDSTLALGVSAFKFICGPVMDWPLVQSTPPLA